MHFELQLFSNICFAQGAVYASNYVLRQLVPRHQVSIIKFNFFGCHVSNVACSLKHVRLPKAHYF